MEAPGMKPDRIQLEPFRVMGIVARVKMGGESAEQFRAIWAEFESRHAEIASYAADRCYYGVSLGPDEQGMIDYLAGMAVEGVVEAPEGLTAREISGADYAVFPCSLKTIGETYGSIFGEWLPESGFRPDPSAPSFEKYPPAGDESSPVLIHIPVLTG
jgi:AraC family transcriptional regulator